MFILMISFFDVSNIVCFSFFKRCANLLILQLEVKIVVYITPVTLSTSFVVVKMDPDSYHNEGAASLPGYNIVWENSNVSYFPPPPPPVEIPQPTFHVEIPQPEVYVEIPQPTGKVKAPIFRPKPSKSAPKPQPTVHVEIPQSTGTVNAPIFHPKTFKPGPLGSKIKILINELVQVDSLVCYNTLSLMNVLDQSLYGLANAGDDTEIRVTFRNGMDPSFKRVFLEMAQKGKKIYKFCICVIRKMENLIFLFSFLNF